MTRVLPVVLLVACSQPQAAPLLEGRVGHELIIDGSTCHAAVTGPIFDGNLWTFGPGATPLRCGVPVESQDYVQGYVVSVQHDAGPVVSTVCLQLLETGTPGAAPYDVEPCAVPYEGQPGVIMFVGQLPDDGLGISEDFAISLQVRGADGDRFAGAVVNVARLH